MLAFWEGTLGLAATTRSDGSVGLAPAGASDPLLVLEPDPDAPDPPRGASGLYHVALLLPNRSALGRAYGVLQAGGAGRFFVGASDHRVSEALYFQDPEGNGLELYADRPRTSWRWSNDELVMTTDPLDVEGLLREAGAGAASGPALPAGTLVGHVHLRVGDLGRAGAFYRDRLGMEVTVSSYPGALFLSWAGYHHHLGLNVWGAGARVRPPAGARGLIGWQVRFADAGSGGAQEETLEDPDGVRVRVFA